MGLVLYLFAAIVLVLVAGWAVYVARTPGELAPWQLAGALVPGVGLLLGVGALALVLWLAMHLVRFVMRLIRR